MRSDRFVLMEKMYEKSIFEPDLFAGEGGSSRKRNIIIIGVCAGILVVALVAVIALVVVRRVLRRKEGFEEVKSLPDWLSATEVSDSQK